MLRMGPAAAEGAPRTLPFPEKPKEEEEERVVEEEW